MTAEFHRPKLVILAPFQEREVNLIRDSFPEYEILFCPSVDEAGQLSLLEDAAICIGEPSWEAIEHSSSLKLLQMTWAGTDKYTRAHKPFPDRIRLCNASGAFGQTMSQYALGAVISLYHYFPQYQKQKDSHLWKPQMAEYSVIDKKMLIFGTGDIGSSTARLFKQAGVSHITGVRRQAQIPPYFDAVCSLRDAAAFLPEADIVINCMPNTDDNQFYLNGERLRSMKKNAVLVNMGRGTFVDDLALAAVLNEGHLLGAAIDVTAPEPLPADHPLWECDALILTPHVAGPSFGNPQTEALIARICCRNIRTYLDSLC